MKKELVCTVCGHAGKPKRITKGSFLIELVLWCFFIIPGLIYSIWRMNSRHDACSQCGSTAIVPTSTPIGARILQEAKKAA